MTNPILKSYPEYLRRQLEDQKAKLRIRQLTGQMKVGPYAPLLQVVEGSPTLPAAVPRTQEPTDV